MRCRITISCGVVWHGVVQRRMRRSQFVIQLLLQIPCTLFINGSNETTSHDTSSALLLLQHPAKSPDALFRHLSLSITLSLLPNPPLSTTASYTAAIYPFFALNKLFMTPLTSPTTVKVPPTRAHMDVTNSYQCFPFFFNTTAMGDRSYEKRASGTSSSVY